MPKLTKYPSVPQEVNQDLLLPHAFPDLPPAMVERFGEAAEEYNAASEQWWTRTRRALSELHHEVAKPLNETKEDVRNVRSEFVAADALLSASFTEEIEALTTATEAIATRTTTLESQVQTATTGLLARVQVIETTYATQTFAEAKKTEAIVASNGFTTAAVNTEAVARAGADGFLSSKYTLRVAAGNVVTGMNLTSSTGSGTDISEITFQADKVYFQTAAFGVGGDRIQLLEVGASGIIFGTDIASDNFVAGSVGWRLTRDTGLLDARGGNIGGFTIAANKLSAGSGNSYAEMNPDGEAGFIVGEYPVGAYGQLFSLGGFPRLLLTGAGGASRGIFAAATSGGFMILTNGTPTTTINANGATGAIQAVSFDSTSSRRFKKNIGGIRNALGLVRKLEGVRFDWRDRRLARDLGFIAEDAGKVVPSVLAYDDEGRISGMNYNKIIPLLVEAVKQLDRRIR